MQKINKDHLRNAVVKAGVYNQVQASQSLELFKNAVERNWGKSAKEGIDSLYIKGGTLTVKMHNSSLAHEIKISEQRILNYINSKIEGEEINRINFKI
ncbi:DUF721 domain-containing protein [Patescibacteria group bacterium]|nr:DUF721 domain-containing protein [Patescibacteria group bacterium]MBU1673155.1 DUF721 domain-containing protein [Patescibacteria group bacterium]MBU1963473.1 DUF721 domain-containing protein [Patescibacteria group bacterium]